MFSLYIKLSFKSFHAQLLTSKLVTITVQKFLVMSEPIKEILDHESTHRQGEHQPPKSDLVDTFQLFKSYLDFKLVDLKQDLIFEQDSFTQKVKDYVNKKIKKEGNKIQFLFNEDILNGLHKLQKQVIKPIAIDAIADLVSKAKTRKQLIKIADTSTGAGLLLGSMRLVQLLTILTTIRKSNRLILGQSRLLRRSLNPVLDCIPYHISHKPHQILCLPNHTVAVLYSSRPFVGAMHGGDRASGTSVSHARNMGTGRSIAPTPIPSTPGWRKSGQDQDINAPTDSKDKYSLYSALLE